MNRQPPKVVSMRQWKESRDADRKAQLIIQHFKDIKDEYDRRSQEQMLQECGPTVKQIAKLVKGSFTDE